MRLVVSRAEQAQPVGRLGRRLTWTHNRVPLTHAATTCAASASDAGSQSTPQPKRSAPTPPESQNSNEASHTTTTSPNATSSISTNSRIDKHRSIGVVERWIETRKYENLYRHDIASGIELADHIEAFRTTYNTIRPHQALDQTPPLDAYLRARTPKPNPPRTEQIS